MLPLTPREYVGIYPHMAGVESPDFAGCLVGNLRAAARVATRVYDSALRETGVRITQVAILAQVRKFQPVTISELAAELAGERSAVARDLAILERSGLVSTAVKADDRRARQIRLTPEGERRLLDCAPLWRNAQNAMADAFGPERVRDLVELTNELVATVGAI